MPGLPSKAVPLQRSGEDPARPAYTPCLPWGTPSLTQSHRSNLSKDREEFHKGLIMWKSEGNVQRPSKETREINLFGASSHRMSNQDSGGLSFFICNRRTRLKGESYSLMF